MTMASMQGRPRNTTMARTYLYITTHRPPRHRGGRYRVPQPASRLQRRQDGLAAPSCLRSTRTQLLEIIFTPSSGPNRRTTRSPSSSRAGARLMRLFRSSTGSLYFLTDSAGSGQMAEVNTWQSAPVVVGFAPTTSWTSSATPLPLVH